MSIKAPWLEYLHKQRTREIETVFVKCPRKIFSAALELGAGDGFQSKLLIKYVSRLIASDYNVGILENEKNESIEYRLADAEEIGEVFNEKQFDLVFSSSLLEHLPSPGKALKGIHKILKDSGITIHIMPTPFWKLGHLLLHIPNLFLALLEALIKKDGFQDLLKKPLPASEVSFNDGEKRNNNPKTIRTKRSILSRLLIPNPHGASRNNLQEFYVFSSRRWEKEFKGAGFNLIKIIKGPIMSGYGLGLDFIRSAFECLGFSSVYIYIAVKNNHDSDFKKYF